MSTLPKERPLWITLGYQTGKVVPNMGEFLEAQKATRIILRVRGGGRVKGGEGTECLFGGPQGEDNRRGRGQQERE